MVSLGGLNWGHGCVRVAEGRRNVQNEHCRKSVLK
jgi:hypothetical protein